MQGGAVFGEKDGAAAGETERDPVPLPCRKRRHTPPLPPSPRADRPVSDRGPRHRDGRFPPKGAREGAPQPLARGRVCFHGVVPFGVDAHGGLFLLLGKEHYGQDAGKWSAFAGRPERTDADPIVTAAREAHEESAGVLGDPWSLAEEIRRRGVVVVCGRGTHYALQIPCSAFVPASFRGARFALETALGRGCPYAPTLEKRDVDWFYVGSDGALGRDVCLRRGFREDLPCIVYSIRSALRGAVQGVVPSPSLPAVPALLPSPPHSDALPLPPTGDPASSSSFIGK